MRTARSARRLVAGATTAGHVSNSATDDNGAALLARCLHVLGLRLLQLVDTRASVLDPMPGHLQHLCGRIAGTLVRLAGRHLGQVVDLLGELRFDGAQGFEEHLRVTLGILLAGLFLTQLLQRLA